MAHAATEPPGTADGVVQDDAGLVYEGGQSVVRYAYFGSLPCVVKRLPQPRHAYKEVTALKRVSYFHVVHMHGAYTDVDTGDTLVALELAHCDLLDAMKSRFAHVHKGFGNMTLFREWMLQLASALRHLHAHNIAHRDVKPENVLLCSRSNQSMGRSVTPDGALPAHFNLSRDAGVIRHDQTLAQCVLHGVLQDAGVDAWNPKVPAAGIHKHHTAYRDAQLRLIFTDTATQRGEAVERPVVKLCDFGYSTVYAPDAADVGFSSAGTMRYAAPEVCMRDIRFTDDALFKRLYGDTAYDEVPQQPYATKPTDVWAYGVTLLTLFTGKNPWKRASMLDPRFCAFALTCDADNVNVQTCDVPRDEWGADGARASTKTWRWPSTMSRGLRHLVWSCLRLNPAHRLTMEQVYMHLWFGGRSHIASAHEQRPPSDAQSPTSPMFAIRTRAATPVHAEGQVSGDARCGYDAAHTTAPGVHDANVAHTQ